MSYDDPEPWAPPKTPFVELPEPDFRSRPPVWPWFVTYCVLMALMGLVVVGMGVFFLLAPRFIPPQPNDPDPVVFAIMGVAYLVMGFVFGVAYASAPFLPRRKWAWIVDIVLICLGMTSVCCMPATIPLLIFWIKPETRQYFD